MNGIKMQLGYKHTAMELSHTFIDHYMTGCAPVYPLIYIYSLRRLMGGEAVSVHELAEHFQLSDTDVMNAWRHWERKGLVLLDEAGTSEVTITFLPVQEPVPEPIVMPELPVMQESTYDNAPAESFQPVQMEIRPQYSTQELALYRSQSKDVERLFSKAEQALGKLLTYNDMNSIFGFYDWLRLPMDVIEYLFCYCTEHGHRSMRYIEKCALDWHERNIDDLEKALTYVHTFDKNYRAILNRMGKLSTFPTPAQRKQIDKWLHELHMPLDMILEACDRTQLSAEKPSLAYVDRILTKWHKNGITTLEAAQKADDDFTKQREKDHEAKDISKPKTAKSNRFINFDQRENDYAQIEKLERQYLLQRLKG